MPWAFEMLMLCACSRSICANPSTARRAVVAKRRTLDRIISGSRFRSLYLEIHDEVQGIEQKMRAIVIAFEVVRWAFSQ